MLKRALAWSGALIVMAVTAALVVLDVDDGSVHRYWSRHSFTSSVLSGVLVLLLTVLIVDRVISVRQQRNQSRAIAAQAMVIVAQAKRTVDAISTASATPDDRDEASDELHTYTQMLLTSAPVLIEAELPRTFLESAQRLAAQLYRALQGAGGGWVGDTTTRLNGAVAQLQATAAPLFQALNLEQRMAVVADDGGSGAS
jgi:hypothetical protein